MDFSYETVAVRCDCRSEYCHGRLIPNIEGSRGLVKLTAFDRRERAWEYGILTGMLFSAADFPQDASYVTPELRDIAAAVCDFDTDFSMELPRSYCPVLPQYTVKGTIQKDDFILVLRSLRTEQPCCGFDIRALLLTTAYFILNQEKGGKLGASFAFLSNARQKQFGDLFEQCGYRACTTDPNVYALRLV